MTPSQNAFPIYTLALCVFGLGLVFLLTLSMTDGFFVYTLDDPYIHLSVAESILEGGYGINPGEYSSPSSSILYPYLLAGALALGLGTYGPLLISAVFSLLSVWLLARFAAGLVNAEPSLVSWLAFLAMGLAVVFGLNAIALPMNGMEHSLHVFGVILALTGLYGVLVDGTDRQLWAVFVGCLICATIRFEGLALVVGIALALAVAGYWRSALGILAVAVGLLLAYGTYMTSLGLPFFPSSVMTKSDIASDASEGSLFSLILSVAKNFQRALGGDRGIVMAIVAATLAAQCLDQRKSKGLRLFLLSIVLMLVAHLLAGRFGWFDRYEVYAVAAMFIALIAILRQQSHVHPSTILTLAMAALVYEATYGLTTMRSPAASANMYQQQHQMHRLAQDFYPASVAVNDLGWVAYGNPNFVLDLWGLGSEEARQLTAEEGWDQAKLAEITDRHEITYVMIYDSWFDEVPEKWCAAAQLVTSKVTAADDTVSIYLVDMEHKDPFFDALQAFQEALPNGARLEIGEC